MFIEDKLINGVLVLRPDLPSIDMSVSVLFKGQIVDWIQKGHQRIVMDLSEVESMDSSGLGTMVSLLKTIGRPDGIVLCNVHKAVKNLFHITRFDRVISRIGL
jgi:anti-sigma B factor antagonist